MCVGGGGSDKALTTMCFSIPPQTCTKLEWQNTYESDSRRPRHPEPSTTKNSSSSSVVVVAVAVRTLCLICALVHAYPLLAPNCGEAMSLWT